MADCKWHSNRDVCGRTVGMMEGVEWQMGKTESHRLTSSSSAKLHTPISVLDSHQELYQAYLNKIIRSAQKTHGEHLVKFEGEKGASINFKLLLEHAMAGMKRDRETYMNGEPNYDAGCVGVDSIRLEAIDSLILTGVDPALPPRKKPSRDSKYVGPPSLAATHPSSYTQHIQHDQRAMPPPPARKSVKFEPRIKAEPRPSPGPRQPVPLCQQIHDPKYLISREALLDQPMYRHLSSDTRPDTPKVISPTFMIALPLGTLIEGANYYSQEDMQPRDASNA